MNPSSSPTQKSRKWHEWHKRVRGWNQPDASTHWLVIKINPGTGRVIIELSDHSHAYFTHLYLFRNGSGDERFVPAENWSHMLMHGPYFRYDAKVDDTMTALVFGLDCQCLPASPLDNRPRRRIPLGKVEWQRKSDALSSTWLTRLRRLFTPYKETRRSDSGPHSEDVFFTFDVDTPPCAPIAPGQAYQLVHGRRQADTADPVVTLTTPSYWDEDQDDLCQLKKPCAHVVQIYFSQKPFTLQEGQSLSSSEAAALEQWPKAVVYPGLTEHDGLPQTISDACFALPVSLVELEETTRYVVGQQYFCGELLQGLKVNEAAVGEYFVPDFQWHKGALHQDLGCVMIWEAYKGKTRVKSSTWDWVASTQPVQRTQPRSWFNDAAYDHARLIVKPSVRPSVQDAIPIHSAASYHCRVPLRS